MATTPDRKELRQKLMLRLFGSPLTLVPALGGITSALTPLFFNVDPGLPLFVGITGLVFAGASVAIRAMYGRDRISREIVEELEQKSARSHEQALDALHARLEQDEDPRDERLLADLRALVRKVATERGWRAQVNVLAAADILRGIDELFAGCVRSLQRSVELRDLAAEMGTESARHALHSERERLIQEVRASLVSLSSFVTQLRTLDTASSHLGPDLARIQAELDRSLAAARATAQETHDTSSSDERLQAARRARAASKEMR